MKKRLLWLALVLGVVLIFSITTMANSQNGSICPKPVVRNPSFHGLEVDFQLGADSPSYAGIDLGLLTQGNFNLGIGPSFANIENRDLVGGYAKIGIYTFDILKGKCLVNPQTSEWYASVKGKLSLSMLPFCSNNCCPIYFGVEYASSHLKDGCQSVYSQGYSSFSGIDVLLANGYLEIWIEWQSWHYHEIVLSCNSPQVTNPEKEELEIGFSFYF